MILRPKHLATALAKGALTEREKLSYLLAGAVVDSLLPSRLGWTGWDRIRVAFVIVSLAMSIIGLLACFGANARGDNRAFLERYLCLSLPLGVVMYAAYYAIYYAMALVGLALGWIETNAGNWDADRMGFISSVLALALFFLWMRASIATAAGAVRQADAAGGL